MGRGARRHWLDTVPLYRSIQRQKNGEKHGAIGDGKEILVPRFNPSPPALSRIQWKRVGATNFRGIRVKVNRQA